MCHLLALFRSIDNGNKNQRSACQRNLIKVLPSCRLSIYFIPELRVTDKIADRFVTQLGVQNTQ